MPLPRFFPCPRVLLLDIEDIWVLYQLFPDTTHTVVVFLPILRQVYFS